MLQTRNHLPIFILLLSVGFCLYCVRMFSFSKPSSSERILCNCTSSTIASLSVVSRTMFSVVQTYMTQTSKSTNKKRIIFIFSTLTCVKGKLRLYLSIFFNDAKNRRPPEHWEPRERFVAQIQANQTALWQNFYFIFSFRYFTWNTLEKKKYSSA